MLRQYFTQAVALLKQNRFFGIVSIVSTALTITFVMLVYMVYDINTSNIAPESKRDRLLYCEDVYSCKISDGSHVNSGLSLPTAKELLDNLPGAERVTYESRPAMAYAGATENEGVRRMVRYVDPNFWDVYDLKFLVGRPFNGEEFSAHRDVAVITENVARQAFRSVDEAIGKDLLIKFTPYRVVGVTPNVSSLFSSAYSEIWTVYDVQSPKSEGSEGVRGPFKATILMNPGISPDEMTKQVDRSLGRLNGNLREFKVIINRVETQAKHLFFRNKAIDPAIVFFILGALLLVVPGINVSGLLSSQMNKRLSELGVRKAYGASRIELLTQLLSENLLLALIGGVVGFILSYIVLSVSKEWLLANAISVRAGENLDLSIFVFLRPSVFLSVFGICLLFNLLSVFVPAWYACKRNIIVTMKGE